VSVGSPYDTTPEDEAILDKIWADLAAEEQRPTTKLRKFSFLENRSGVWVKKDFDPSQPRDEGGRWTDSGGGTAQPKRASEERVNERVAEADAKLNDPNAKAEEYKARITDEIATRLRDNAAFKEMVATGRHNPMLKPMWDREADPLKTGVSILVNQWAGTSGDGDRQAVAMQLAVQREFGLTNASTEHFLSEDLAGTMEQAERDYAKNGEAYRAFARAMYDNTQAELKAQGISEMTLYRGMSWDRSSDAHAAGFGLNQDVPATETLTVTQQPASSWSYNPDVARAFSGGVVGTVMAATVPAERILSTMKSGMGCKDENEIVVLGGQDTVNSWTGAGNFFGKGDGPRIAGMLSRPGAKYNPRRKTVQRAGQFKAYDESEPRDESGRWTVGAGDVTRAPDTGKDSGQAMLKATEAALNDQSATREAYKARIAKEIAVRANKDPRWVKFRDYVGASTGPAASEKLVSQLIEGWANTSMDSSSASVAMQQAIKDEFGLKDATMDHVGRTDLSRASDFSNQSTGLSGGTFGDGYRAFVRAMYDNTQADLAAKGIKEMTIYRGMHFARDAELPAGLQGDGEPHRTTVVQQPASSWAYAYSQATTFSSEAGSSYPGAVMAATVPASRILSTMNSGFGCKPEREVVLLGGKDEVTAQAWDAGGAGPPKSTGPLLSVKTVWLPLERKDYDPSQPRDERGRWAATGTPSLPNPEEGSYFPGSPAAGTAAAETAHNQVDEAINDMSASKQEYKARISQEIGDRLEGSAAFNDYAHSQAEAFREHPYQNWSGSEPMEAPARSVAAERAWAASNLIQSWAGSSGDNHVIPAALQQAVKDEFGLKDATTDHLLSGQSWESSGTSAASLKEEMRQEYAIRGEAYRDFARAMYENTQADLAAKGITEMTLYRGMSFDTGVGGVTPHPTIPDPKTGLIFDGREHAVTTVEQPASSWSYSYHQASGFAPTESGTGAMLAATVPASRILSTMDSGWGCKDEKEVVVLGGKDEVNSWAWYANHGFPPSEPGDLVHTKTWADNGLSLDFKAYDPDQARDERGRWAATGAPTASAIEAFGKPGWSKEQIVAHARRDEADRALNDHSTSRPEEKVRIAKELSDRLEDNPAWKEYLTRAHPVPPRVVMYDVLRAHVPTQSETAASSLVQLWAQSSGDNRPQAVAMQMAIRDEFGLKDAVTDHLGIEGARPDYEANGAAYRAFARAMYDNTQADLASKGIKEMTLYRGMSFGSQTPPGLTFDGEPHATTVSQQPASSWSYDFGSATIAGVVTQAASALHGHFDSRGAMLAATVPASRILSTLNSGIGCEREHEVVVLGGNDQVAAQAWSKLSGRPLSPEGLFNVKTAWRSLETKDYDPNQARDAAGRWTAEGNAEEDALKAPAKESGSTLIGRENVADAAIDSQFDSHSASEYKERLSKDLAYRLQGNPDWEKYLADGEKRFGTSSPVDTASGLIAQWANSSGDNNVQSVIMQQAIRDEFHLNDARMDHLLSGPSWDKSAADLKFEARKEYREQGPGLRAFARAMYQNTQEELARQGISEMTLYRGLQFGPDNPPMGFEYDDKSHPATVNEQPASSWAYSFDVASGFAGGSDTHGAVIAATVPASRILSTMKTGFGCKDEKEVVVLGGKDDVAAFSWSANGNGPPSFPEDVVNTKTAVRWLELKAFDENQPRDEYGRWTTVGGNAMSAPPKEWGQAEAQSREQAAEQALNNDNLNPNYFKGDIVRNLSGRLANNPAFRKYAMSLSTALLKPGETRQHHAVNSLVAMWAGTSGDGNINAVAMQKAINEEFGLKARTEHMPMDSPNVARVYAQNGEAYRAFARAMYDNTQEELARDGIKEMTLYRGVRFRDADMVRQAGFKPDSNPHQVTVGNQPASSWAYSFRQAYKFSGGRNIPGALMAATVPASRILSTLKTGIGCKNEDEVVVLGSTDDVVAAQAWGNTPTGAPHGASEIFHTKLALQLVASLRHWFTKAYDESQPRDERGRWTHLGQAIPLSDPHALSAVMLLDKGSVHTIPSGAKAFGTPEEAERHTAAQSAAIPGISVRVVYDVPGNVQPGDKILVSEAPDINPDVIHVKGSILPPDYKPPEPEVIPRPTAFAPAKSLEDAAQFTRGLGIKYPHFEEQGDLPIANEANRQLFDITEKNPSMVMPKSVAVESMADRDTLASYNRGGDYLAVNRNGDWSNAKATAQDQANSHAWSDSDPAHVMTHELAHLQHAVHEESLGKEHDAHEPWANPAHRAAAAQVSRYAATEPAEFVAETYTGMLNGKTYSQDVMDAYHAYDGPPLPSALPSHKTWALLELKEYDPNQARDERGRWEATGAPSAPDDPLGMGRTAVNAARADEQAANKALFNPRSSRDEYKERISWELGNRLKDSAPFNEYVQRLLDEGRASRAGLPSRQMDDVDRVNQTARLVHGWAETSGDTNVRAIAMQQAIKDEFGLEDATTEHLDARVAYQGRDAQARVEQEYQQNGAAYRAFARAMYDNTQADLAAKGITEMTVYRGLNFSAGKTVAALQRETGMKFNGKPAVVQTAQQPASSWSYSFKQAANFAGEHEGAMMAAKVPASRILSTMNSGFGCKPEKEVVLLGGKDEVSAQAYSKRRGGGPPPNGAALFQTKTTWADLETKAYDPDQPRDDSGRWTSGGGGGAPKPKFAALDAPLKNPPAALGPESPYGQNDATKWSQAQIAKALKGTLPNPRARVDYDSYLKRQLVPVSQFLGKLSNQYPEVGKMLLQVGQPRTKDMKDYMRENPQAIMATSSNEFGYSAIHFGSGYQPNDPLPAEKYERDGADTGFSYPESKIPGSTAVHEFGHAVANAIQDNRDAFTEDQRMAFNSFFFLSKTLAPENVGDFSRYAQRSRDEAWAEAFSAYYLGSEHPVAKAAGDVMKKVFGKAPRASDE